MAPRRKANSDIEDDDDDDPDYYITRRSRISTRQLTRKHLTSRQHDKLEDYYLKDNYPSYKKKKKIAYSTGLEITQVINWFQNRRAKFKLPTSTDKNTITARLPTRKKKNPATPDDVQSNKTDKGIPPVASPASTKHSDQIVSKIQSSNNLEELFKVSMEIIKGFDLKGIPRDFVDTESSVADLLNEKEKDQNDDNDEKDVELSTEQSLMEAVQRVMEIKPDDSLYYHQLESNLANNKGFLNGACHKSRQIPCLRKELLRSRITRSLNRGVRKIYRPL